MPFAPLDGVRVVDFSWNVAGPTSTKVLAALGAEVFKIEWPTRPDPGRMFSFSPTTEGIYDSGGFFADLNIGKRSFTVDARSPEGLALLERLITASDMVVESYSPRVMAGWGLTYERMRELNPGIIYLSVSGFGHSGPHGSYVSYGPTAQAASGVTYASGEPGREPAGWGYSFLDVMTGYQAAYAAVAALRGRTTSGQGTRIDLSQVETGAAMLGPILLDCAARGAGTDETAFPPGNRARWRAGGGDGYRYEHGAPYNVYPTADGDHDAFCAIGVLEEDEWKNLRACMGDPEWARDERFADLESRLANQDDLDARLAEWTAGFGKYELMDRLQHAGVRCAAVQSGRDRLESDPSLAARDVFQRLRHPVVGEHRFEALPLHINGESLPLREHWPLLGHDTDDILRTVLRLDEAEIDRLREAGVTWPAGLPFTRLTPETH
ncbi:CoA transferase [Thermopolyspora sp. NPDC052614]|uniref:CaiB/BaiF CoA transferase family protein n=1 Tax=Thermopolyspora sp. NPDC052614 TaxID=3155682 RepID=UPI003434600A